MTPATRAAVVKEALSWLHTPYQHQQMVKGAGVDCAMIMAAVYSTVGIIPLIDPRPYPNDWHLHRDEERYLGWITKYCDITDDPQPGDIATFQYGRCVSHGAIVIAWPVVLHAYMSHGMVILSDVSVSADLTQRLRKIYTLRE